MQEKLRKKSRQIMSLSNRKKSNHWGDEVKKQKQMQTGGYEAMQAKQGGFVNREKNPNHGKP